ncbi:LysM peptidoglycan-binding domain-containing protein [Marinibaculum pumilum]|uniref:LysM peptidoglycan-binding domain-containing protein n=1 Tax=Marinibaculum pumilum TaxID=1766165 RepID=A0ABV7L4P4_9PROT
MSPGSPHRRRSVRLAGATMLLACSLAVLAAAKPALAAGPCGDSATVSRGDTLAAIARRCGTAVDDLMNANPQIADPRRIRPGWVLRLPGAPAASGAAPATQEAAPAAGPAEAAAAPRRPANRDGLTREGYQPARRSVQSLMIWPREGAAGSRLTVSGSGLPEGEAAIGVGPPGTVWQRVAAVAVGPSGEVETEIPVPDWARQGEELVVTLQNGDGSTLNSGRFRVTGSGDAMLAGGVPDGSFSVRGTVRQGRGCMLLETPHGHLYSLSGGGWRFDPGTRVALTGLPAAAGNCDTARGTIEVVALHPDDTPETIVPPPPSAN